MTPKDKIDISQYPDDLIEIIRKLLFDPINHRQSFRDMPENEKQKIVEYYIKDFIYNNQF